MTYRDVPLEGPIPVDHAHGSLLLSAPRAISDGLLYSLGFMTDPAPRSGTTSSRNESCGATLCALQGWLARGEEVIVGVAAVIAAAIALGTFLACYARRPPALAAGSLLVVCGIVAFAVFPLRRGFDLAVPLASLGVGLFIVVQTRTRSWGLRLALAAAPVLLFGDLIVTLHEMDEVVELRTTDADGDTRETRLAVLDHAGATWIGAGPRRRWAQNMRARPRVQLVRGGVISCRLAAFEVDPQVRLAVLSGLERKYRIAKLMAALGSPLWLRADDAPEETVAAVRLETCEELG